MNENKQKPTPTSALLAYVFYHGCLRFQLSYHVLNFNTLCCLIYNTSKNDSVAGSANNGKVLITKIVVYFTRSLYYFLDTLDKTLNKIPIKNFKRFL